MLTIAPCARRSAGAAACERKSGAFRLVPMRSSKSAISISPSGVAKNDDALLTSPSRRPNVCSVCSTSDGSFAVSRRSAWISATELARTWFNSADRRRASPADFR